MNDTLKRIFTTWRSYPDGASTLEATIEKAFNRCTKAVQQYHEGRGSIVTAYDAGWYRDKTEKHVNFEFTWPEADVVEGNCVCTISSPLIDGMTATKRPIDSRDGVEALVICLGKLKVLTPSRITIYQDVSERISAPIYVKTFNTKEYWVIEKDKVEEYSIAANH